MNLLCSKQISQPIVQAASCRMLRRIREGSLDFRNTQQVATACGTHAPRQSTTKCRLSSSVMALPNLVSNLVTNLAEQEYSKQK